MTRVAFFYATFPRPTETFVRRELRALDDIGFKPDIYSIWKGDIQWEGRSINRFKISRLLILFFWIPYWAWKKPRVFKRILVELWCKPCPNFQNWNETFLALGFALVEARKIEHKKYDLIHGVWATMPATSVFALNQLIDVPYSMGAHAYDVFRKGGDWLLPLKLQNASFIRTSSSSTAQRIHCFGVEKEKVRLIRRGLSHWAERKCFELVDNKRLELLSVGRLVEKKGYFCQLDIVNRLDELGIPFRLRIVGDGPLKKELLAEASRLGLIGKVEFLGSQKQDFIRNLYLTSDVFLFTGIISKNGDRDGIPNVIPEAMSSGCLVIASCFAGASEAFEDGDSGYTLNPYNPHEWSSILSKFWFAPNDFKSVRESAMTHCKQVFDVKRTASSIASFIKKF